MALGVAWAIDASGIAVLAFALSVIAFGAFSIIASLSGRREVFDEMAVAHDGAASRAALASTLIAIGVVCIWGTAVQVAFAPGCVCCLSIGFGLLARGIAFARLEGDDAIADH